MRLPAPCTPSAWRKHSPRASVLALGVVVLLGLLTPHGGAQPEGSAESTDGGAPKSDSALRINGVFTANLPTTERRSALRFTFNPRFGDLTKYDHLRVPVGLRYGVTSRWELLGEITGHISHGLKGVGLGTELGLSEVHFGTKYNLGESILAGWETGVGIDYFGPVSSPPPDVVDGLEHVAPYITFSRHLADVPQVRVFWSVGADLVSDSHVEGNLRENQLGDDAALASAGLVWDLGALHATFQTDFGTTRLIGNSSSDSITFRPGLLWEVPERWTPTQGRWIVGTGLRTTLGPDNTSSSLSVKVRIDSNLKQWWQRRFGPHQAR